MITKIKKKIDSRYGTDCDKIYQILFQINITCKIKDIYKMVFKILKKKITCQKHLIFSPLI